MAPEDRQHHRDYLVTDEKHDFFHIEVQNQRFRLDKVNDVSISGTGVQLPIALDAGTPVTLVFDAPDCAIQVNGTVVWCESVDKNGVVIKSRYRGGIEFDPKDQNNALFFMALREFVDPFDGALLNWKSNQEINA